MFKKKGIGFKTFLFTSILIVVAVMISFGLLYVIMPDYYYNQKQNTLIKNSVELVEKLGKTDEIVTMSTLITEFCLANNTDLTSVNREGQVVPLLSWPLTNVLSSYYIDGENGNVIDDNITISIRVDNSEFTIGEDGFYKYIDGRPAGDADINSFFIVADTVPAVSGETLITIDDDRQEYSEAILFRNEEEYLQYLLDVENPLIEYVSITATVQPIDEAKGVILSLAPYLLGIDIIIAFMAAYFYARRFSKPIIQISDAAVRMQHLEPDVRSNIRSNDELGVLSENLDLLYNKLCANIDNLKNQMDTVVRLEKSKTDFLQAASHELKTPLAGLNGIVEGMIDSVGKYKNRDLYLAECKKQIDRMTGLVYEILNASRLDSENIELAYEKVHLGELMTEILETYSLFLQEKSITVICDIGEIGYNIITDRAIFKNILSNIVSNAVKYTETGGMIMVGLEDHIDYNNFYVENQCDHIPEEELQRLFEPFYTGSYSRDRNQSGTGLGLYIVKKNLNRLKLAYKFENTNLGLRFNIRF